MNIYLHCDFTCIDTCIRCEQKLQCEKCFLVDTRKDATNHTNNIKSIITSTPTPQPSVSEIREAKIERFCRSLIQSLQFRHSVGSPGILFVPQNRIVVNHNDTSVEFLSQQL